MSTVIPAIFLSVRSLSPHVSPDTLATRAEVLTTHLMATFPGDDNSLYIKALHRGPLSVINQRLEALTLLPLLLHAAGLDPAALCLARDSFSRPYVVGRAHDHLPSIDFNLSHTATCVACGLSVEAGAIGVDIEGPIPPARSCRLIERYATSDERVCLQNDPHMDFARLWTTREALGKREGRGHPLAYNAARIPADTAVQVYRLPGDMTLALAHDAHLSTDTIQWVASTETP